MASHSTFESGIYIPSFAAMMLIAALVTVGVSLITLLITLLVMLKSCESRSAGVVEVWKSSDDYSYCKLFALHAELNRLDIDSFPAICKDVAVQYIKQGQYMRDLNITVGIAERYLGTVKPSHDGLDVVLMDIDDLFLSEFYYTDDGLLARFNLYGCKDCSKEATNLKRVSFVELYMKIRAAGWPLALLSRKPEKLRNTTVEQLISAGCSGWSSLIMRSDDEMPMDSCEYFTRRRGVMQSEGFHITAVISSQMDALTGPYLGKRIFKFPNPIYYNTGHPMESRNLPQ
ncbi:unnamed protein product [Ilex paraguariensis]